MKLRAKLTCLKAKLTGDVIVDKCFMDKPKTNHQVIIAGAVDRAFTQAKLKLVPDGEQATLEQFLLDRVSIPSLISSDAHPSYFDIEWYGYDRRIDNHAQGQLKKTCPVERLWALCKTFLRRTYHYVWKETGLRAPARI